MPLRARKTPSLVPVSDEATRLQARFAALSDPTRLAVVTRLATGEVTISALAEPMAMALGTFSRHVKILEEAGLIVRRVEGRTHHLALAADAFTTLRAWLGRLTEPDQAPARRLLAAAVGVAEPAGRERALAQAEALRTKLARPLRVLRLALGAAGPAEGFDPERHAARGLAERLAGDPGLRAELARAVALEDALGAAIADVRSGGDPAALRAYGCALGRLAFGWRGHPFLADAFPRDGDAA